MQGEYDAARKVERKLVQQMDHMKAQVCLLSLTAAEEPSSESVKHQSAVQELEKVATQKASASSVKPKTKGKNGAKAVQNAKLKRKVEDEIDELDEIDEIFDDDVEETVPMTQAPKPVCHVRLQSLADLCQGRKSVTEDSIEGVTPLDSLKKNISQFPTKDLDTAESDVNSRLPVAQGSTQAVTKSVRATRQNSVIVPSTQPESKTSSSPLKRKDSAEMPVATQNPSKRGKGKIGTAKRY
jgi:hypothetical protein